MRDAPPSSRRLTTTVQPTTSPRPNVWSASTNGKAIIDCDSRSHVLRPLSSSRVRRSIIGRVSSEPDESIGYTSDLPDNLKGVEIDARAAETFSHRSEE